MNNIKALMKVTGQIKKSRRFLSELMQEHKMFPASSFWFGMAEDGLPVCVNSEDSVSPNVILWDKFARQSLLVLKVICEYVFTNRHRKGLEFVVLTEHPEDYGQLNDYGMGTNSKTACIGIIPFNSQIAEVVLRGLCKWIHEGHTSPKRPVVILIDELENMDDMSDEFKNNFRHILDLGRKKNVFVVATSSKNQFKKVYMWLDGFQAEIYGRDIFDEFEYSFDRIEPTTIIFYAPRTSLL